MHKADAPTSSILPTLDVHTTVLPSSAYLLALWTLPESTNLPPGTPPVCCVGVTLLNIPLPTPPMSPRGAALRDRAPLLGTLGGVQGPQML